MELTYENMKEMVQNYFDALPFIEGPQDEARMLEFFAPGCKVISGDPIRAQSREDHVKHICGHADVYRAVVSYQPAPLGIMIDERRKMVSMLIVEEFKHPVTGEFFLPEGYGYPKPKLFMNVIWELCLHDNKVKAKSETIIRIPGYLEGV